MERVWVVKARRINLELSATLVGITTAAEEPSYVIILDDCPRWAGLSQRNSLLPSRRCRQMELCVSIYDPFFRNKIIVFVEMEFASSPFRLCQLPPVWVSNHVCGFSSIIHKLKPNLPIGMIVGVVNAAGIRLSWGMVGEKAKQCSNSAAEG